MEEGKIGLALIGSPNSGHVPSTRATAVLSPESVTAIYNFSGCCSLFCSEFFFSFTPLCAQRFVRGWMASAFDPIPAVNKTFVHHHRPSAHNRVFHSPQACQHSLHTPKWIPSREPSHVSPINLPSFQPFGSAGVYPILHTKALAQLSAPDFRVHRKLRHWNEHSLQTLSQPHFLEVKHAVERQSSTFSGIWRF